MDSLRLCAFEKKTEQSNETSAGKTVYSKEILFEYSGAFMEDVDIHIEYWLAVIERISNTKY